MPNLRNSIAKYVLSDIIGTVLKLCNSQHFSPILVVDRVTLVILSQVIHSSQVIDAGISLILLIEKDRAQILDKSAIYLIFPNDENIKALSLDFKSSKNKLYADAHIFWMTTIITEPRAIDFILKNECLCRNIRSFVDVNLGFGCYNANTVVLCLDALTFDLLKLQDGSNIDMPETLNKPINKLANSFLSFLSFLDATPNIRYMQTKRHFELPYYVAKTITDIFDQAYSHLEKGSQTAEVLIVDRSLDAVPFFSHEYFFEAAVYDILNISVNSFDAYKNNNNHSIYSYTDNQKRKRFCTLTDKSTYYDQIRFKKVTDAIDYIRKELIEFNSTNATANYVKNNNDKTDLGDVVTDIQNYNTVVTDIGSYLACSEALLTEIKSKKLQFINQLEKEIITGLDSSGKSVNTLKVLKEIAKVLAKNDIVDKETQMRLILLYTSCFDGVDEKDINMILSNAGLTPLDIDTFKFILNLNLRDVSSSSADPSIKHTHITCRDRDLKIFYKKMYKALTSDAFTYYPKVGVVAEKLCNNELSKCDYPCLNGQLNSNDEQPTENWLGYENDWGYSSSTAESKCYIIFVLGPIFFPEIRIIHELTKSLCKQIYIVGTSVTTPHAFLQSAFDLSSGRNTKNN